MTNNDLLESEVALIRRIIKGETELYYQLIRPYQRMIYAAAFSILRDETEAEDVVQQTFLNGLAALRSFRAQSRISNWLTQIAINEARMRLRKQRHHGSVSIEEVGMTVTGEPAIRDLIEWKRIPSKILEQEETRKILIGAFESLPRIYREVFVLRDVEGLSIAETGQVLGIREANVKTRLSRARMKMRELISDRLGPQLQRTVLKSEKALVCKVVWQEASTFIDDEIAQTLRAKITVHLRTCRGCKSVIAGIRNVIRLMGDPRALPLPLGFSLRLQKRLRSHFSALNGKRLARTPADRK